VNPQRALSSFRAPAEAATQERTWTVVRDAYRMREPVRRHRSRGRLLLVPAVAIVLAAVTLSPAGATVGQWIRHALGVPHAAPALFRLPAPGSLLVSGSGGTWTVAADGSSRRLGPWRQASWSPHGLFVAVTRSNQLAAVDPHGTLHWTLARPAVRDPRWYVPTGYRVAYLSADSLRVVAGDGTGDHVLATGVASVAPSWQPGSRYRLAYVTRAGMLVIRGADSKHVIWTASLSGRPRELAWSSDGRRLLAVTTTRATVYGAGGRAIATMAALPDAQIRTASLSPDGSALALVRGGADQDVVVVTLPSATATPMRRRVLSGTGLGQLAWSPDGRWLLVSWPAADQWVFVRVAGTPRIAAVSRIARQFSVRDAHGEAGFPRIEGWCCTARGDAG
jgi:WD40-like Beta Propeller Repeat